MSQQTETSIICDQCGSEAIAQSLRVVTYRGDRLPDVLVKIDCDNCGRREQVAADGL